MHAWQTQGFGRNVLFGLSSEFFEVGFSKVLVGFSPRIPSLDFQNNFQVWLFSAPWYLLFVLQLTHSYERPRIFEVLVNLLCLIHFRLEFASSLQVFSKELLEKSWVTICCTPTNSPMQLRATLSRRFAEISRYDCTWRDWDKAKNPVNHLSFKRWRDSCEIPKPWAWGARVVGR